MVIQLAGSSETARALLADMLLHRKDWRYMALEDVFEDEDPTEVNEAHAFSVIVGCNIAKEEMEKGCHVIVTMPVPELMHTVKEEMGGKHVTVYLGKCDEETAQYFDHVFDTGIQSVNEVFAELDSIVANG